MKGKKKIIQSARERKLVEESVLRENVRERTMKRKYGNIMKLLFFVTSL